MDMDTQFQYLAYFIIAVVYALLSAATWKLSKKLNVIVKAALSFIIIPIIVFSGAWYYFNHADVSRSNASERSVSSRNYVRYSVYGTPKKASLTYTNESGGIEQKDCTLPFTLRFPSHTDFPAHITAQNTEDFGFVTVEIYKNSNLMRKATSEGAYKIASASIIL